MKQSTQILWERTLPKFCFCDRVVMSPETFHALKTVSGQPEAMALPPNTIGKAMVEHNGRTCWHAVERQHHFGAPVYYARPITVRAYRPEPA